MNITCRQKSNSLFQTQGSVLNLANTSITGCRSDSDGGAIQAYDSSQAFISACSFKGVQSDGFGGVVSAFGSDLYISYKRFEGCFSRCSGGAVWSSAFPDLFRLKWSLSSQLRVESSVFDQCTSSGAGGAILADSSALSTNVLIVSILYSRFSACSSAADGGALRFSGSAVWARLSYGFVDSYTADASGGGISLSDFATMSLIAYDLNNNTALGAGKGAIHVNRSYLVVFNTFLDNDRAPLGGGGAVFWQGWMDAPPMFRSWCPTGTYNIQISCSPPGSYSTSCQLGTCVCYDKCSSFSSRLSSKGFSSSGQMSAPGPGSMNTNQEADSYHCGSNITALYGPCIASDYRRLQSSGAVGPVYSGVPFEFTVVKKDAYNNTILSDSASLLRASAVQEDGKADQRVSILGFVLS